MNLFYHLGLILVKIMAAVVTLALSIGDMSQAVLIQVVHTEAIVESTDADECAKGNQDKTQGAVILKLT